jgi:hypothetical protein
MNWNAIGSISELVGAIAVVASLAFVGIQLKRNTKALRLSSTNAVVDQFSGSVSRLAENAEMAALLYKGVPNPDALSDFERYRFNLQIQSYLFNYSNCYLHYESGTLDEDIFSSIDSQMRNFCNSPGLSDYWRQSGGNFPEKFRNYMENSVLGNFDPLWSLPGSGERGAA